MSRFKRSPIVREPLPGEEWRQVVGFEGLYEVSSFGRVCRLSRQSLKSYRRPAAPKIMRVEYHDGYERLTLSNPAGCRHFCVHSLVAAAFIGPRPEGHHVAHLDGDRLNNRHTNLAYATPHENAAHMAVHGTVLKGEDHPRSILTEGDVIAMRAAATAGASVRSLAIKYGVGWVAAWRAINGLSWGHVAEGLPENAVPDPWLRWTPQRKLAVLNHLRRADDPAPILAAHGLTQDEVASWERRYERWGERGLKQTKLQELRT